MLKACQYCGRIHAKDFNCGRRPQRRHDRMEAGRYSYAFTVKSREIKEDSYHLCTVCLEEGRLTCEGLETHHIAKIKDAPELLLEDGNLICLCRRHHEMADAGVIAPEHLRQLAGRRQQAPGGFQPLKG